MNKYIIIIMGTSGTGKTTIQRHLLDKYNIPNVVTHTTRPRRNGEIYGTDYYFESNASWPKINFVEQTKYNGYKYGSSLEALHKAWKKNSTVSIVLDYHGAVKYKKRFKQNAKVIWLMNTRFQDLKQRLIKRDNQPQVAQKRLKHSRKLMHSPEFINKYKNLLKPVIIKNKQPEDKFKITDKIIKSLRLANP